MLSLAKSQFVTIPMLPSSRQSSTLPPRRDTHSHSSVASRRRLSQRRSRISVSSGSARMTTRAPFNSLSTLVETGHQFLSASRLERIRRRLRSRFGLSARVIMLLAPTPFTLMESRSTKHLVMHRRDFFPFVIDFHSAHGFGMREW